MTSKILVWDWPTRVFHWGLALSFCVAFLTAENDAALTTHVVSGYLFAALILFRLLWGLIGSRYARFTQFVRSPTAIMRYLGSLHGDTAEHHLGHNPAGAVAIVLMLALGSLLAVSGWQTLSGGERFEEWHEGVAFAMLTLVGLHLAGVVFSSLRQRENLPAAMLHGHKTGAADARIPHAHGIMAVVLVAGLAVLANALTQGALPTLYDPAAHASQGEHHGDREEDDD